jgi:hypothetical protein
LDQGAAGEIEALRDHAGRLIWGSDLALDRSINFGCADVTTGATSHLPNFLTPNPRLPNPYPI